MGVDTFNPYCRNRRDSGFLKGILMEKVKKGPFALLDKKDPVRYHYFLGMKFLICNIVGFSFLFIAFLNGWIDSAFAKAPNASWFTTIFTYHPQTTYIEIMILVFMIGWIVSVRRVFLTSREINHTKMESPPRFSLVGDYLAETKDNRDYNSRAGVLGSFFEQWAHKVMFVKELAFILVTLGLLGTVIGFIMALSGVKPGSVPDVSVIVPMVSTLINGMGFALYTTVVGVVTSVWLGLHFRFLKGGTKDLGALLLRRREREEVEFLKRQSKKSPHDEFSSSQSKV